MRHILLATVLLLTSLPGKANMSEIPEVYLSLTFGASVFAAFAMIPATIYLREAQIEEYKDTAVASQIAPAVGFGVFGLSVFCEAPKGSSLFFLGIATLISQILGLYTDIGIWKDWDEISVLVGDLQVSSKFWMIESKKAILGGTIANGVLHFLSHAAALTFGLGSLLLKFLPRRDAYESHV